MSTTLGAADKRRSWALGALGLALLVALWWLGVELLGRALPMARQLAPLPTFGTLGRLLAEAPIWAHIGLSMQRVAVGLAGALAIGVPLGLWIGAVRGAEQLSSGAFQFLRMISPLSWMPIVVMLLGIGNAPIYFLLIFAAVWPIIMNTAAGVRAINPQWLQLGQSLSATRWELLSRIVLPAVLGHILTGLRLAIGIVWIVLVPCEMLGVSAGLGYFILDTRDRLAYSELMAAILLIGLLGFALDAASRWAHRRWTHQP